MNSSRPEAPAASPAPLLHEKVAIVTGAGQSSGIGFQCARLFIEHGARVAALGLDADALQRAGDRLGDRFFPQVVDIRSRGACRAAVAAVAARWKHLDILVNNAGLMQPRRIAEVSPDDLDAILDVNLRGTLHMSQEVLPAMSNSGSIICIASVAAQRGGGLKGGPHYAAAKGGVAALARSMARELGPTGVRVNIVNPGVIITPMTRDAYSENERKAVAAGIPLGRMGRPDEVAAACLFLASDLSSYITGASIDVNGGLHIH